MTGGTSIRNRIAGLIRFSYPALNGFAKAPEDIDRLRDQLFETSRLERRFALFEALTIPSLAAQKDAVDLIVLTGPDLPAPAMERLSAALASLPGAQIVTLPPMLHYQATQEAFARILDPKDTHLTSFRLDDDDAVDRNFVARLRALSDGMLRLLDPSRPLVIGHNKGIFLERGAAGSRLYDVVEKLPIGIGLSLTAPVQSGLNIFRRNHRLLPQFFTTFTDAETPAFIRTIHADNDSAPHASGVVDTMTEADIDAVVARHFPFTGAGLRAL